MVNPDSLSRYDAMHAGHHSTKLSHDPNSYEAGTQDTRIHTLHSKTSNNFFQSPSKMQEMMRRPGSA